MTPAELSEVIRAAIAESLAAGEFTGSTPDEIVVERPKNREHGDYASNVALRLAKAAGRPPRDVAEVIAARLRANPRIAKVEVAGPGFLNITLAADALGRLAGTIVEAGESYGRGDSMAGQKVNLEFVSANPTGPITVAGSRWAAVGDSLARLMSDSGADVTREYYFNDHGAQIDRFARSLMARAHGQPIPEDGYAGAYIDDVAARIVADNPGVIDLPADQQQEAFRRHGVTLMFDEVKASLHNFGVDFDVYFHEESLHETGAVAHAIDRLRAQGEIFEADGAIWLRTSAHGDDKDRVVIKSDGQPAYIAADLAYYLNKRERGFDRCILLLGADHHGYIGRLMAMCAAFGDTPGVNLEIRIGQMVTLLRDGQPVRMSKRAGDVITLDDLVDAIGVDAARYALARSSTDSALDVDLGVWIRKSNDNPVFYVQYAHARLSSLQRNAAELGISRSSDPDLGLLSHDREVDLLGALGEFPRIVESAAELRAPHRIAHYLEDLAGTYHRFYDACRVLPMGDEPATPLTDARLWLCEATRVVIANGLRLLGVSAPERM